MIENIELADWLSERSTSVHRNDSEIIYTHAIGLKSVLVKREVWRDDLLPLVNPMLKDFYSDYLGASIGGTLLMATSVEGGLPLSLGYKLQDFYELKNIAIARGLNPGSNEDIFMMGYAGLFFYGYTNIGEKVTLRRHDCDFKSVKENMTFLEVLDNWWEINIED